MKELPGFHFPDYSQFFINFELEYLKSFTIFVFSWVLFVWNLPIIDLWLDTKLKYLGIKVLPYNILWNRMSSIWFWISIVVSSLSAIPTFWLHKCSSLSFSEGLNSDLPLWNYNCHICKISISYPPEFYPPHMVLCTEIQAKGIMDLYFHL